MRRIAGLLIALSLLAPAGSPPAFAQTAQQSQQTVKQGANDATQAVKSGASSVGTQADAAAREGERHGIPRWVWPLVALAIVLLLLIAIFSRRRRKETVIRTRLG